MYQCPNCGGHVVFDPALQKMKCEFCDSLFDPEPGDIPEETAEQPLRLPSVASVEVLRYWKVV